MAQKFKALTAKCQAWQTDLNPQNPYGGRRKVTPTYMQTHNN